MRRKGRRLFGLAVDMSAAASGEGEPLANAPADRSDAIQRLQVGLFGMAAMVLLVGLASIIGSQADRADQAAVPDAAPTTEPRAASPGANPLADAGVVPDLAVEPSPAPLVDPLVLPPPTSAPVASPSASPQP